MGGGLEHQGYQVWLPGPLSSFTELFQVSGDAIRQAHLHKYYVGTLKTTRAQTYLHIPIPEERNTGWDHRTPSLDPST